MLNQTVTNYKTHNHIIRKTQKYTFGEGYSEVSNYVSLVAGLLEST